MVTVNYGFYNLKDNTSTIKSSTAKEFIKDFKLNTELVYDLGFDPSNSCTGVCCLSIDKSVLCIVEIVNKGLSFDYFRNILIAIIEDTFANLNYRYIIQEQPLPYASKKYSVELKKLKDQLKGFLDSDAMTKDKADLINPVSWRKGLMTKENPEPATSKKACVFEVIRMYPITANFETITYNPTNNSGYDGYEACGILHGYLNRFSITNESSIVKILGPKNTSKVALSIFCYTDDADYVGNVVELIKTLSPKVGEPKVKYYNEEEGIYANSKMAVSDDFTLTTITNEIDTLSIMHMFSLKPLPLHRMYMLVLPLTKLKKSTLDYLDTLNLNKEIFY